MFIFNETGPDGPVLISQASHAWLAWQVAEHWGNRHFPRPAPRAEALAAAFAHDSGWSVFDAAPDVDAGGRPLTFDRMPVKLHLDIWRESIERTRGISRYAALLVATHFNRLLSLKDEADLEDDEDRRLVEGFGSYCEALTAQLRTELADDARYRPALEPGAFERNAGILAASDRLSVFLCASMSGPFELNGPGSEGPRAVEVRNVGRRLWRLQPWPFEGHRVRLQCEGRRLDGSTFANRSELLEAMSRSKVERIDFTLVRPSAVRA